ncbi:MAG: nucleotide pyrophosphatase/phosphodiesterase family protein [Balneolales bacterium]
MKKTVVLNVVGLTPDLIGKDTPFLSGWFEKNRIRPVGSVLPAVTCSAQATYLTGVMPSRHGIVGNGWYFRDMDEIKFWRQSNKLIQAPRIWDKAKQHDPDFTCANLFWWYNMNSTVDYLVTPRPVYRADGVKIPDILTDPAPLRDELQGELGPFPLFKFWGPATDITSTRWIADATLLTDKKYDPTLTLVYLPHLDYNLQRLGPLDPAISKDLSEIDGVCEQLIRYYEQGHTRVIVLSEYGIAPVSKPVSLNRTLRREGYITVREEMGQEILIPGSSRAFVVADHQIAHIYIRNSEDVEPVRRLLGPVEGVEAILDEDGKKKYGLDHDRSGELVALAEPDAWFTYYYWLDDDKAPDFAPNVDIHNKPGYDPAELFVDPGIRFPRVKAGRRLLQKKLGFRYVMDLIPIEGSLVKGSHGRHAASDGTGPLLASNAPGLIKDPSLRPTDVHDVIWAHLTED